MTIARIPQTPKKVQDLATKKNIVYLTDMAKNILSTKMDIVRIVMTTTMIGEYNG